jgi:hypothetical protein
VLLDDWEVSSPVSGSGQAWVLKALREAGNSLVAELYGIDEELLCERLDGDLSLKEIAAHIRDAEELALEQLTAIAEGKRGAMPARCIDLLPMERNYRSEDVAGFIAEFRGLRQQTASFLWTAGELLWEVAGRHPYRGAVTLGQIARELAQHDLEHLWQVRQLKHNLGAGTRSSEGDAW